MTSNRRWVTLFLRNGTPRMFVVPRVNRVNGSNSHSKITRRVRSRLGVTHYRMLWLALAKGMALASLVRWLSL